MSSTPSSSRRAYRAPGRVNIIGEHVDYLGGLVLPFACDLEIVCEVEPGTNAVELDSEQEPGRAHIPLDGSAEQPAGWARHVWGVVETFRAEGKRLLPVRGTLRSSIPVGAGLSSSAALEVVVALAARGGERPDPEMLARAELLATGVPCGVMDQTTVLNAKAGHAILLDCSTRAFEHVPVHPGVGFVVIDTGTRRELADGRYAERRAEVERVLAGRTLSEIDLATVTDPRLRHAVSENARVPVAAEALRECDIESLGSLVSASHASLRDDFEVSSPDLDRAVDSAMLHARCTGARLVGAGFAGCVLAVVEAGAQDDVAAHVMARLESADAYGVRSADAAGEIVSSA